MIKNMTLSESWSVANQQSETSKLEPQRVLGLVKRCAQTALLYVSGYESENWRTYPVVDSLVMSRQPVPATEADLEALLATH